MFKRSTIAAAAALAVAPVFALQGSAQACYGGCDDGDISVRVSDSTPASGEQFIARGKLIMGGRPAADHVVKVQTWRDGAWEQISGAKLHTSSDGSYRMRLILSQTGERTLRVVGVGQGDEPTERQRFSVTVH